MNDRDALIAVQDDFLAWCAFEKIHLYDWKQEAFGEATRRENGRFVHRLVGISVPRGNGKSDGGAKVGAWVLKRKPRTHVLSSALGYDSAGVVLRYGQAIMRVQPGVDMRADSILLPGTGSRWTITSREHTTSRGEHPDLVIYDECGWARDDELFASLLAAQASIEDPLFIVISTVGRRKSGPLWRIKELAEAGAPGVFWYYRTDNLSPKITVEFLEGQRRILLPGQYAREHQNQWVETADSFTSAADTDAAMGTGWAEQAAGQPGVEYEYFVDIGTVHDPTVIAIGHAEETVISLDKLVTFQGSREEPVQIPAVEQALVTLASVFAPRRIRIESWQGVAAVQRLTQLGLPVEVFNPTAKAHAEEWPVLAQRLTGRTLVLFPHARLREELLNLVYEVGPQGVRVIDRGSVHQDHAVAVRGVVASLHARKPPAAFWWVGGESLDTWSVQEIQAQTDAEHAEKMAEGKRIIEEAIAAKGYFGFHD